MLAISLGEDWLANLKFTKGTDINKHISELRQLCMAAHDMGANISENCFIITIIKSLPASWDSVTANFYSATSSADLIACIALFEERCKMCEGSMALAQAMAASTPKTNPNRSTIKCDNCGKLGHT